MPDPIYSSEPAEEQRMLRIRDNPAARIRDMAASRAAQRMSIPFQDTELLWIIEKSRPEIPHPILSPSEAGAMITQLARELQSARAAAQNASA